MKDLTDMHFFNLLSTQNNESVNENELAINYRELVEKLLLFCENETNYFSRLQALTYARVEFWSLQKQRVGKEKKNDLIEFYLEKVLLLIESLIENCKIDTKYSLADRKIIYQKDIVDNLDWDISDNDIIELAASFERANIAYKNGAKATFIDIERHLERFFNRKPIKRPHNKKSRLPERVTITPFLDKLKNCFLEDYYSKLGKRDK